MNDQKLSAIHEMFKTDHDLLRDKLLEQLQREPQVLRRRHRRWIPALCGIAATLAVALALWWALLSSPELTWAQVARQLQQTQTASYQFKMFDGDPHIPLMCVRIWFRAPDQSRTDWELRGPATQPTSPDNRKSVPFQLTNSTRYPGCTFYVGINSDTGDQATVIQDLRIGPAPVDHTLNFDSSVIRLRELDSEKFVRKGEEILDGQKVIRFEEPSEAFYPNMTHGVVSMWVNAATSLPVRFSSENYRRPGAPDRIASFELRDLQFDIPLKDDLFEFPDLDREKVSQRTTVILAQDMSLENISLKIISADGHVLATSDDLDHVSTLDLGQNGNVPTRLLLETARKRIETYCQTRQKLTVHMDGQETQPMEVFGRLKYLKLVPPVPPYEMPTPDRTK